MTNTMTTGNLKALLSLTEEKGCTVQNKRVTHVLSSGAMGLILDENADFSHLDEVRKALRLSSNEVEELKITIDYQLSLRQMIEAGSYDWVNSDITEKNFPLNGKDIQEHTTKLFHFDKFISSDKAEELIKKDELWRPANIESLLTRGAILPKEQLNFTIIALGSVASVGGSDHVAYLDGGGAWRRLGLDWRDNDWGGGCRFLAVRN